MSPTGSGPTLRLASNARTAVLRWIIDTAKATIAVPLAPVGEVAPTAGSVARARRRCGATGLSGSPRQDGCTWSRGYRNPAAPRRARHQHGRRRWRFRRPDGSGGKTVPGAGGRETNTPLEIDGIVGRRPRRRCSGSPPANRNSRAASRSLPARRFRQRRRRSGCAKCRSAQIADRALISISKRLSRGCAARRGAWPLSIGASAWGLSLISTSPIRCREPPA